MPHNVSATDLGLALGTLVKVSKEGRTYIAVTTDGVDVTDKLASHSLKNAHRSNKALRLDETKSGGTRWSQVAMTSFARTERAADPVDETGLVLRQEQHLPDGFESQEALNDFIANSLDLKPKKLRIGETWWKFAVRAAVRGKNLLVVGPSGCGKTLLANALKVALNRKFYYVNLGATQDPRSTLIGNTHYSKEAGTFVALSYFAQAIQVPNAIILCDEISRAHPEAANILMTVLDATQRYMRVDESADSKTVHVADGVTFVLTANVGSEYTATRTMDRALLDRCTIFEMAALSREDELENLKYSFPDVELKFLEAIASIADMTRQEMKQDNPKLETIISTRTAEDIASMIRDGFSLEDAAEVQIYPYHSPAGGAESPRAFVRAGVQRFLPTEFDAKKNPYRGGSPATGKPPWED